MSGERQAVCVRRVDVRRPEGVGRGVAQPHEVGTNTKESKIANRLLKSRWQEKRATAYKREKAAGQGLLGIWRDNLKPMNYQRTGPAFYAVVAQLKPD